MLLLLLLASIVCTLSWAKENAPCITPEGHAGSCVDVHACEPLRKLLQTKPLLTADVEFIRQTKCNGPHRYPVCCASSAPTPGPTSRPPPVTDSSSSPCIPNATLPDPGSRCCGVDSSGPGDRINLGGNQTAIDKNPWIALINYKQDTRIKTLCGGALISSKYVLTAGHCIVGEVLKIGYPFNVRLGEYDTSTDTDCVPADGGDEDCSEPVVSIPIDRTIPHPQYDPYATNKRNDIALIRLRALAPYTDFIRPICMPVSDVTTSDNFYLEAAGWGTSIGGGSNRKHSVEQRYRALSDCQKQYSVPRRNVQLWPKQICAGGVKDKDSCTGDSGGPLMSKRGNKYEIVGVVSFGTTPCGLENVPGVYSKVYEYRDWIRSEVIV